MKKKSRRFLNIVLFQLGWWASFIAAYQKLSLLLLMAIIVAVLVAHFAFVVEEHARVKALSFVALLMACGYLLDSLFFSLGILQFTWDFSSLAPLWILAMWWVFPISIGHSFAWLEGRYLVAFLFGAIGAPLAYRFGSSFDLIYFKSTKELVIYGIYWGFFLNFALWLKQRSFFREYACA